ncbi:Hypothetical protein FKW44_016037 [Caligus rogercresseyi]|uniref:Uncharacterized protein n=1 Tax=Caligus rogercresseyi TaxID=217165 RepID=A0A7T8H1U8_CALRO|nr:Hypothetical protein FKW44_016037 [Caligus rogercresseyi]
MFPITEEEVKKALPKEDANADPLGLDGRSFRSLQPAFLTRYFNAMLAGERPPENYTDARPPSSQKWSHPRAPHTTDPSRSSPTLQGFTSHPSQEARVH